MNTEESEYQAYVYYVYTNNNKFFWTHGDKSISPQLANKAEYFADKAGSDVHHLVRWGKEPKQGCPACSPNNYVRLYG